MIDPAMEKREPAFRSSMYLLCCIVKRVLREFLYRLKEGVYGTH
jgi:hypothetical protein